MQKTDIVESEYLRDDIPDFRPGDTVKVHVRVVEGTRERIQIFQGVVISRKGGGTRESFTVRKISFGIGVERTFPLHSPIISEIDIVSRGKVMAWSPPSDKAKAPRSSIFRIAFSIASRAAGPSDSSKSPISRKRGSAPRSNSFSAHRFDDPECSASRIRDGAKATPRKKVEFSSDGTPTTATIPLIN